MSAGPLQRPVLPEPADPESDDAALTTLGDLCIQLGRRGCPARLTVRDLDSDPEVRLVVGVPGDPVGVELLGPCPAAPLTGWWYAVRSHGEDRVVWRGPARTAEPGEVILFIEMLMQAEPAAAGRRYQPIG